MSPQATHSHEHGAATAMQADTMSRFQELEDEVQALRDSVAADKEELLDWEESTAAARSRSLFFKVRLLSSKITLLWREGPDVRGRAWSNSWLGSPMLRLL
eukprot:356191-Chlamydomonas_euryale.AAC.7